MSFALILVIPAAILALGIFAYYMGWIHKPGKVHAQTSRNQALERLDRWTNPAGVARPPRAMIRRDGTGHFRADNIC